MIENFVFVTSHISCSGGVGAGAGIKSHLWKLKNSSSKRQTQILRPVLIFAHRVDTMFPQDCLTRVVLQTMSIFVHENSLMPSINIYSWNSFSKGQRNLGSKLNILYL